MIKPMLAEQAPVPEQNNPNKIWETKYDGARIIAMATPSDYRLQARSGSNKTGTFPELELATLKPAIIDGEVVSSNGLSFQDSIQHRINRTNGIEIAMKVFPAKLMVFDCLEIDGQNIENYPLEVRKELLAKVLIPTPTVELASYTEDALTLWQSVLANGLEGMVGKRKDGKYIRDNRGWEKVKAWKRNYGRNSTRETFMVVGYTQGTGWRESTFGALVLGRLEKDGSLTYIGEVGTGMKSTTGFTSDMTIAGLMSMFSPGICPWKTEPEPATWIKPFAIRMQYLEYTNEGVMRFPSFKGII